MILFLFLRKRHLRKSDTVEWWFTVHSILIKMFRMWILLYSWIKVACKLPVLNMSFNRTNALSSETVWCTSSVLFPNHLSQFYCFIVLKVRFIGAEMTPFKPHGLALKIQERHHTPQVYLMHYYYHRYITNCLDHAKLKQPTTLDETWFTLCRSLIWFARIGIV